MDTRLIKCRATEKCSCWNSIISPIYCNFERLSICGSYKLVTQIDIFSNSFIENFLMEKVL